jgi:hypothetical protein
MSSIVTDRVTATVFCKYLENLHNQDKCEGVVGGAAELLGFNPSTLGSRIGKAGNQKTLTITLIVLPAESEPPAFSRLLAS